MPFQIGFFMCIKYTKEYCQAIALTCNTRKEFKQKNIGAYLKSRDKKWLDEFGLHAIYHTKWTYSDCLNAASQCLSLKEFSQKFYGAYNRARKSGWLNSISFAVPKRNTKRTNDEIISIAKKYTSYSDFYRKERNTYNLAYRRGLLSTFTWLKRKENDANYFHADNVYVYEFTDTKTAYVGRTISPARRHAEHTLYERSSVYNYAKTHGISIPQPKYVYTNISVKEGKRLEGKVIEEYRNNGWALLNKAPAGSIGSLSEYSKDTCINAAKKYRYKKDFSKAEPKIYAALLRHKWLNECTWLKSYKRKWADITFDKFIELVQPYKNRSELCKHHPSLYYIGNKHGWTNLIFKHCIQPKPVIQYTLNGEYVAEYNSIGEAARALNCDTDLIINCCKHRRRYTHHYKFEYKENISSI